MKYSVLMTVYKNDNALYFEQSLDSMIKQTIAPDEIVVVKDGPVPKKIQQVINSRKIHEIPIVEVQLPENLGLGLALNEGIKVCRNELLARMDADDISSNKRCEKELNEFVKNPKLDIVGCPVLEFVDEIENIVGKRDVPKSNHEIHKFCRRRDPFNHPTVMYRKSAIQMVGGYANLRKNQDTDLWIKLLRNGAITKNLEEPLLYFRFDESTYKKRKNWENTRLLINIRHKAYKSGFCSFRDFILVAFMQVSIFVMPVIFQKVIYKKILRK